MSCVAYEFDKIPIYNIEMIQKRALKSIFPNKGYDDILCDLGMCTLHERQKLMLYVDNILRTCKVIHTNYTICYLKRGVYIMI